MDKITRARRAVNNPESSVSFPKSSVNTPITPELGAALVGAAKAAGWKAPPASAVILPFPALRAIADACRTAPALAQPARLSITELEPVNDTIGKTILRDGSVRPYPKVALWYQSVADIPAAVPALFDYLKEARERNICLIRGAPANLSRTKTRRWIAYKDHKGVNRGDHGFVDTPTRVLPLDIDGVAMSWQADSEGAIRNIVARLGPPFSDASFVWFFSASHGLKFDAQKRWHGELSDTDVRVRLMFITKRALSEAETKALTLALKARCPDLKIDPAISRLVQPNYIRRPRWLEHRDRDVLGDIPTIGWVQGDAEFLDVPDELLVEPEKVTGPRTRTLFRGEHAGVTVASHPDAETAVRAIGGDGSIRSHLMAATSHLLLEHDYDAEAAIAELVDMVEQHRTEIENNLIACDRSWAEVQGYLPDNMRAWAEWLIDRRPVEELLPVEATYPEAAFTDAGAARETIERIAGDFFDRVVCPDEYANDPWMQFYFRTCALATSIVWAMLVATGLGKTTIVIMMMARWLKTVTLKGPIIYAVPRHKLGEKIRQQFLDHGIDARIFRGRKADDPQAPASDPDRKMCMNLEAVKLAQICGGDVNAIFMASADISARSRRRATSLRFGSWLVICCFTGKKF